MGQDTDLEAPRIHVGVVLEVELAVEYDRNTDDVADVDRSSELEELVPESSLDAKGDSCVWGAHLVSARQYAAIILIRVGTTPQAGINRGM